jgi:hypothetical protein
VRVSIVIVEGGPKGAGMRRCRVTVAAVGAMLAGCGGSAATTTTHVEALSVQRDLGCSGWYETTGEVLAAHLIFAGPVRHAVVNARFVNSDQSQRLLSETVSPGATRRTLRVHGVTDVLAAVRVSVDNGSGAHAACELANPH